MTRRNESGGGGLTGATGDLTPDDADQPFVPAELRDMSNPEPESVPDEDPEHAAGGGTTPGESGGDEFSNHEEHF